jgi:glycosyltransferase involved in cell wall biosynthesis
MRTIFVYYNPHPIHKAWADSVTDEQIPFVSKKIFDVGRIKNKTKSLSYRIFDILRTNPIALQTIAVLNSYRIPKADVYLIENASCIIPVLFRKKKKSKVILINDDIFFYLIRDSKGLMRKIYLRLLKSINGIISSSEMIKKVSQEYTRVPNIVNYPFSETEKYSKYKADIKSDDMAFVGMLANQKRIDLIIESFLKVSDEFRGKLYLIGKEEDKIEALECNRDNKSIIVTGWTLSPEDYMKRCGFYINPAEREAFGMNIMEAMCMGIPPLVSKKCGAAEISKNLIIEQNTEDIVKKLRWLKKNPAMKKKLGEKCRKEALKYTKENSKKQFKENFHKLIEQVEQYNK